MPFPYVYICDLLEELGHLVYRDRPMLVGLEKETNNRAVNWLTQHRRSLNEFSVDSAAVMMMFTPENWTDRDYGLDEGRLEQLIARVLNLPRDLHIELRMWRDGPAHEDLAVCVQRVMDKMTWEITTRAIANKVTVEQIDQALLRIASHNPNSSPEVRSLASKVETPDTIELLGKFYRSLGGREAKWLTRLILKSYGPVKFPHRLNFSSNMQFLPTCVRVNAEILISEAFPALRDGPRVIRGFASVGASINRLPITPMTAPASKTRKPLPSKAFVNQLPTPPTTTPRPPSSAAPPMSHNPQVQSQTREPLAPLVLNSTPSPQSSGTKAYEPSSSMSSIPTPNRAPSPRTRASEPPSSSSSFHTTPRSSHARSSQRSQGSQGSQFPPPKPSVSMIISGTGTCRLTTQRCPLSNCIFLLAPCISSVPWITENLLSWHGSRTITSLRGFSDPSLPRRCPQTGRKYRKTVLVESNRAKSTVDFLKRIEKLNLRRSKGKKEWVEVFDWRILEAIAKVDRGKELGYNPWRRCWIGAV